MKFADQIQQNAMAPLTNSGFVLVKFMTYSIIAIIINMIIFKTILHLCPKHMRDCKTDVKKLKICYNMMPGQIKRGRASTPFSPPSSTCGKNEAKVIPIYHCINQCFSCKFTLKIIL